MLTRIQANLTTTQLRHVARLDELTDELGRARHAFYCATDQLGMAMLQDDYYDSHDKESVDAAVRVVLATRALLAYCATIEV